MKSLVSGCAEHRVQKSFCTGFRVPNVSAAGDYPNGFFTHILDGDVDAWKESLQVFLVCVLRSVLQSR